MWTGTQNTYFSSQFTSGNSTGPYFPSYLHLPADLFWAMCDRNALTEAKSVKNASYLAQGSEVFWAAFFKCVNFECTYYHCQNQTETQAERQHCLLKRGYCNYCNAHQFQSYQDDRVKNVPTQPFYQAWASLAVNLLHKITYG
jgi:hypothetical protein